MSNYVRYIPIWKVGGTPDWSLAMADLDELQSAIEQQGIAHIYRSIQKFFIHDEDTFPVTAERNLEGKSYQEFEDAVLDIINTDAPILVSGDVLDLHSADIRRGFEQEDTPQAVAANIIDQITSIRRNDWWTR